jgi:hypothetical protein
VYVNEKYCGLKPEYRGSSPNTGSDVCDHHFNRISSGTPPPPQPPTGTKQASWSNTEVKKHSDATWENKTILNLKELATNIYLIYHLSSCIRKCSDAGTRSGQTVTSPSKWKLMLSHCGHLEADFELNSLHVTVLQNLPKNTRLCLLHSVTEQMHCRLNRLPFRLWTQTRVPSLSLKTESEPHLASYPIGAGDRSSRREANHSSSTVRPINDENRGTQGLSFQAPPICVNQLKALVAIESNHPVEKNG